MTQARPRQARNTPSSVSAPGRRSASSSRTSSALLNGCGIVGASGMQSGQHAHVRLDAARQRAEVVAAFQAGHDAALGVLVGDVLDALA